MLKRSKSSRRNHRSSNVVTKLLQQQRLDLNEDNNRCSDGDSSQSSRTAVQPLFVTYVCSFSSKVGKKVAVYKRGYGIHLHFTKTCFQANEITEQNLLRENLFYPDANPVERHAYAFEKRDPI
ncbi:hypothetical protein GQX74_002470 [Glossina fuscipes]|nr:hypothetical protein GQX74_002470 [Glossina fuscipes]